MIHPNFHIKLIPILVIILFCATNVKAQIFPVCPGGPGPGNPSGNPDAQINVTSTVTNEVFLAATNEICIQGDDVNNGVCGEDPEWRLDIDVPVETLISCSSIELRVCRRGDFGQSNEDVFIYDELLNEIGIVEGLTDASFDCTQGPACTRVTIDPCSFNEQAGDGVFSLTFYTDGATTGNTVGDFCNLNPGPQTDEGADVCDGICPDLTQSNAAGVFENQNNGGPMVNNQCNGCNCLFLDYMTYDVKIADPTFTVSSPTTCIGQAVILTPVAECSYQEFGVSWTIANGNAALSGTFGIVDFVATIPGTYTVCNTINNQCDQSQELCVNIEVECTCPGPDKDGDGVADFMDLDDDNDGILDSVEGSTVDSDGDGIVNSLDLDSDNDGIPDAIEACGDITLSLENCMLDSDGSETYVIDGNSTCSNGVIVGSTCNPINTDGDSLPDFLDQDSDGDGCSDALEAGNGEAPNINSMGNPFVVDDCGLLLPAAGTVGECNIPDNKSYIESNIKPTVSAGADQELCGYQEVLVSSTGDYDGFWSGGIGYFENPTGATTVYHPSTSEIGTTTQLIWQSNLFPNNPTCLCLADTLEITIYPIPEITLTLSDDSFCPSDFVIATAETGYTQYNWYQSNLSGGADVLVESGPSNDFSIDQTGQYYLEASNTGDPCPAVSMFFAVEEIVETCTLPGINGSVIKCNE